MSITSTSTVDRTGMATYAMHEDHDYIRLMYAGGRLADIETWDGAEWVAVDCCHAAEGWDWTTGTYPREVTARDLEETLAAVLADALVES
jgi:hypothetical protein